MTNLKLQSETKKKKNIVPIQAMLVSLNIVGSANINGAEIVGSNMVYNYEQVIRQITYTNQKPAYYLNRQGSLTSFLKNRVYLQLNELVCCEKVSDPY